MLTKHRKMTRGQLVGGTLSLTTLAMAGLFVTASGTVAAERVRDQVSATLSTDLARLSAAVPVALQSAPTAPAAPSAPGAPAAPDAPEAPEEVEKVERRVIVMRTPDGEEKRSVVVTMSDGDLAELRKLADGAKLTAEESERMAAKIRSDLPEIREINCGKGESIFLDMEGKGDVATGKKRQMILCKDRIARLSEQAATDAARTRTFALASARMGIQSALMGLKHARRTIESQAELSDDQRREALAGIDQALKELEAEKIDVDEK